MRTVAELKNFVGESIINCLRSSKECIFGGAVRDYVADKSFSNVKDFDIFINRWGTSLFKNDLLNALISRLGKEYQITYTLPDKDYDYRLPEHCVKEKIALCFNDKKIGGPICINLDIVYSSEAESPICLDTLDADVNSLKMNWVKGISSALGNANLVLKIQENIKNRVFNACDGGTNKRLFKLKEKGYKQLISEELRIQNFGEMKTPVIAKEYIRKEDLRVENLNHVIQDQQPLLSQEDYIGYPKIQEGTSMKIDNEIQVEMLQMLKDGGIRTAGEQVTLGTQKLLTMGIKGADMKHGPAIEEFINCEAGKASLQALLFIALRFSPGLANNPKAKIMAKEFGTASVATGMNGVLGQIVSQFTPMIEAALAAIPDSVVTEAPAITGPAVRVGENNTSSSTNQELEEEVLEEEKKTKTARASV